ncbi:MAG: adenylate/guanylate cyclase domain-containing protein, partial [Gammaproteobacteria bacterium]|nr:adenylate/guanylate cyclase domain-containing protein [Gammaproteobacteria bacterium]
MECHACHAPNLDTDRVCRNCGGALAGACPGCSFRGAADARFCANCGLPLVPVADPIIARPPTSALSGNRRELKQATVLFADIVSSTEQIAHLDPESAMDRLQPAILAMCSSVEKFGGTVLRTLGDGVMALFGVPVALERHAVLACEAALHMQATFSDDGYGFSIRIGLHSGLVASDPLAADGPKGGGAHGVTIHLASRVVTLAPTQGILVTGDCHRLAARL